MLSHDLFNILACPVCKGKLDWDKKQQLLHCPSCCLNFPVRDGIPIMLPDEAFPGVTALQTGEQVSSENRATTL